MNTTVRDLSNSFIILGDKIMGYGDGMINNSTRVAVCLCVDTSSSMDGEPIAELNRGVSLFFEELHKDEVARYSAEIAVVEFNSDAELILPFTEVDSLKGMDSELYAGGYTALGAAVRLALSELEKKKTEYKKKGLSYYQPWLVIMSDGQPNDDYLSAASRAYNLSNNNKLLVIPIGIGHGADLSALSKFSATVPAQELKNNNFQSFFKWLSASVKNQSGSKPTDNFNFDQKYLGWMTGQKS
jgi:uncharacterized protein YegL